IVITPDGLGVGGIRIASVAPVNGSNRPPPEIAIMEVPMNLIVVPENGKGSFHFTSASNATKKMMEIAASGMQQPKEVLNQGVDFELSTALQEDNSPGIIYFFVF
nr:hypothetical protein [Tanacetum cinerariifolium]